MTDKYVKDNSRNESKSVIFGKKKRLGNGKS